MGTETAVRDAPTRPPARPPADPMPDLSAAQRSLLDLQGSVGNAAVSQDLAAPDAVPGDAAPALQTAQGALRDAQSGASASASDGGPGGGGPAAAGASPDPVADTGHRPDAGPATGGGTRGATDGPPSAPAGPGDRPDVGGPGPRAPGRTGNAAGPATAAPPAPGPGSPDPSAPVPEPALPQVEAELAEHERWGTAQEQVGQAQSAQRAAFIAEQAGSGLGEGAAQGATAGAVLGLGSTVATRALASRIPVPIIGSIIGGAIGAWGLCKTAFTEEGRAQLGGTVGRFGQGASRYETVANSLDAIAAVLDVAANALDTVALVTGVIAAVAWLGVIPSFGTTSPVAATCTSIASACSAASAVIGLVKMGIGPIVLMLRSLHTFTSQADPREVQASGAAVNDASKGLGGVLGGLAGSAVGQAAGKRGADRLGLPTEAEANELRTERDAARRTGAAATAGPTVTAVPDETRPLAGATDADLDAAVNGTAGPAAGAPAAAGADARSSIDLAVEGLDRPGEGGWGTPMRPEDPHNPLRGISQGEIDANVATLHEDPRTSVDRAVEGLDRPGDGWGEHLDPADSRNPLPAAGEPEVDAALGRLDDEGVEHVPAPARPATTRRSDVDWYDPVHNPHGTVHLDDVRRMSENRQLSNWHPGQLGGPIDPQGYRGELGQHKVVLDPGTGAPLVDPRTGGPLSEFAPEAFVSTVPDGTQAVRTGGPGQWAFSTHTPGQVGAALEAVDATAAGGRAKVQAEGALPDYWPGSDRANDYSTVSSYTIANPRNRKLDPSRPPFVTPVITSVAAPQPEARPSPGGPRMYPGGALQINVPGGRPPQNFMPSDPNYSQPLPEARSRWSESWRRIERGFEPLARATEPAGRWGQRTMDRRVAGTTVGRWDDALDSAQLGELARGRPPETPATTYASGDALERVAPTRRSAVDAVVERVDPDYERPPGTPEQLAEMRREMALLERTRSGAQALAATGAADLAETRRREAELERLRSGVAQGRTAAAEQAGQVMTTAEANAGQQQRQEQAGAQLGQSAARLTGMATLETMLGGWVTGAHAAAGVFYSIGTVLDSANDAGRKCTESAGEAAAFMARLTEAKLVVGAEAQRSPLEQGRLSREAAALEEEQTRSGSTDAQLGEAERGLDAGAAANAGDAAAAAEVARGAQDDAAAAARAREDRLAQHERLKAALESWAQRHRQSRTDAVAATVQRLTERGYVVKEVQGG